MPVFLIAGLTLREAVRRKTLIGAMVLGLLPLGMTLILIMIQARLHHGLETGRINLLEYAVQSSTARSSIISLALSAIKSLSALFAILLAGGSVSSEIERGLLAVILPKPLWRWQILLGKWLGLNLVLMGSTLFWTGLVWLSISRQVGSPMLPILSAAPILALYPLVVCTVTLSLSTFAQRLLGTSLALALVAVSWFDGILNMLSQAFDVSIVHTLSVVCGLILPQGYIGWWVEGATEGVVFNTGPRGPGAPTSPRFLSETLGPKLHIAHLDAIYIVLYIALFLVIGSVVLQRRDV